MAAGYGQAQSGGWVVRNQRPGGYLWGIASNGTRLVAVGTEGRILTSTDGVTWEVRSTGGTDWLLGVAYDGNDYSKQFVAVGDKGRIFSSRDGLTWTAAAGVPTSARLNNVCFGTYNSAYGGLWVAVGEGGTVVASSDNGLTWRAGTTGVTGWLRGLTYLMTRYYFYAPNGSGTAGFGSIRYLSENGFVASGQDGAMLVSTDGLKWTRMVSGTTEDLEAIVPTYFDGNYGATGYNHALAIGSSGVVRTYDTPQGDFSGDMYHVYSGPPPTLPDYAAWKAGSLGVPVGVRLRGLARINNFGYPRTPILLATGENGVVILDRQLQPLVTTANLVAAVYHGSKFYVVGSDETILQQAGDSYLSRLGNLSTRGFAGGTRGALIGGLVIDGTAPKRVLIRAVGPSLAPYGVVALMPRPILTGTDAAGRVVGTNSGWGNDPAIAAAARTVGAFALAPGSFDAAMIVTLDPGNYTFQIQPIVGTASGVALFEAYDLDAASNTGPRLLNVSTRGYVGVDNEALIGGFVITGASRGNILIRGIGPALRDYGVADAVADCAVAVYRDSTLIATNDDWSTNANAGQLAFTMQHVGAFPLADGSADAALLLSNLAPGAYTVQLTARGGRPGTGLIELYELP